MNRSGKCRVLCIGIICVDEILYCQSYPLQDSDTRIMNRRLQTGGNATNNCSILSQLNVDCDLLCTFSNTAHYSSFVKAEMKSNKINIDKCEFFEGNEFPVSTVIINLENGSRTILHYRKDWPEVSLEAFKKLDLSQYSWIHLEGRNKVVVKQMVQLIEEWNKQYSNSEKKITISIEAEKKLEQLEFIPLGDVVFVGKDFAKQLGYNTMHKALDGLYKYTKPNGIMIVPWAEEGAVARGPSGTVELPAFSPEKVVDTLGAGDTFCAATIAALSSGHTLKDSVEFGCKVAGTKVGMCGYHGLAKALQEKKINL